MNKVFVVTHVTTRPNRSSFGSARSERILGVCPTDEFVDVQAVMKAAFDTATDCHKLFREQSKLVIGIDDDGQWDEVDGVVIVNEYPIVKAEQVRPVTNFGAMSVKEALDYCYEHKEEFIRNFDDVEEGLEQFEGLLIILEDEMVKPAELPNYGMEF